LDEGDDKINFFKTHLTQDLLKNHVKGSSPDEIKLKVILDSVLQHLYKNHGDDMKELELPSEPKLKSSESMQ